MAEKYPESMTACRLYERTSAKGRTYMTGLWGGVRVAMLKTSETDRDGHPIWEMRLSQAPPRATAAADPNASAKSPEDARRNWQAPADKRDARQQAPSTATGSADDLIPF